MTADKRSVHTDALHTLGFIHTQTEGRDAIHLAVEQVTAGSYLNPGAHIGRDENGKYTIRAPGEGLGIVDPFIQGMVRPGDQFWLVVYPRKITSLRHVWSHPDFDDLKSDLPEVRSAITSESINQMIEEEKKLYAGIDAAVAESKQWIIDYAARVTKENSYSYYEEDYGSDYTTLTYEDLMSAAETASIHGSEYISKGPLLEGVGFDETFWEHWEVITGKKRGNADIWFSCSC